MHVFARESQQWNQTNLHALSLWRLQGMYLYNNSQLYDHIGAIIFPWPLRTNNRKEIPFGMNKVQGTEIVFANYDILHALRLVGYTL